MGEQSRSPGRPPCPRRLGPVLKAGWLKKQRSIMKNWQQRWFVLRGDQLFYYKDKDETKPQVRSAHPVSSGHHCGAPGSMVNCLQERGDGRERPSHQHLHPSNTKPLTPLSITFHWDFQSEIYSQLSHSWDQTWFYCDTSIASVFEMFPSYADREHPCMALKKKTTTQRVVQCLRLCASKAGAKGSIPGLGTKIPHVLWHSQKKKILLHVLFNLSVLPWRTHRFHFFDYARKQAPRQI